MLKNHLMEKKNSNGKRSSDESTSDYSDDPDYLPKGTKKPTNKKPKQPEKKGNLNYKSNCPWHGYL